MFAVQRRLQYFPTPRVDDPITPLRFAEALHGRLPRARALHRIDRRCHVPSIADYDAARLDFVRAVFGAP